MFFRQNFGDIECSSIFTFCYNSEVDIWFHKMLIKHGGMMFRDFFRETA